MGRNNKQRRAARAHRRSQRHRHFTGALGASHIGLQPRDRFAAATYSDDDAIVDLLISALRSDEPESVAEAIFEAVTEQLEYLWGRGWQPADVVRVADRDLPGRHGGQLARAVIGAQAVGYAELGRRVAPHWMRQVDQAAGEIGFGHQVTYAERLHRERDDDSWDATMLGAIALYRLLAGLPTLERLTPPPSEWSRARPEDLGTLPNDVLHKVRALLAKAESTPFDAEAEALTAKAQELMARHRIDRALLAGTRRTGEVPIGRRIGVGDPYADTKASLLANIAKPNDCRAVWSRELGFSTVFGFADDLTGVEELYTSLLVQATAALQREGSKRDHYGRSRTTRFRRSFLAGFAIQIGVRLRATVEATVAQAGAEAGTDLLPVLASRAEAVDDAVEAAFGDLGTFAPRISDGEGWAAGRLFGDIADLGLGPALDRSSA